MCLVKIEVKNMSYYITRIFNNKLKLGVILFIFAAPILDILMALVDVFKGASVPVPGLVTFWDLS